MSAESVCEAASARGVRVDVEYAVTGRPVYADQVRSNAMDMSLSPSLSSRLSLLYFGARDNCYLVNGRCSLCSFHYVLIFCRWLTLAARIPIITAISQIGINTPLYTPNA